MSEIIADDTDVAVMLLHHWQDCMRDIVFTSEQSKKSWSVKDCLLSLPGGIKDILLLIHAISGSDSTSAIYGLGKLSVQKNLQVANI